MDSNTDYSAAVEFAVMDYCIVACKDFVPEHHTAVAGKAGKLRMVVYMQVLVRQQQVFASCRNLQRSK